MIGRVSDEPAYYRILVQGQLCEKWSFWFDGLAIAASEEDDTILFGKIADQAALHGCLSKIRDLGLPILLVERVEDDEDLPCGDDGVR